ncbi:hypothetical protein [Eisenibacter elegans]|uniref:hypothetical protein n=1 Tax=Eisenibacter elegans TaxID=997 RepID=UPI00042A7F99|nr:hypothetical protein [Eisenibacter elegans]
MKVFESDYSYMEWDEVNSIFSHIFKPGSEDLNNDVFKEEMQTYVQHFKNLKPLRAIVNNKDMRFALSPDLQEWHAQNVFPQCVEAGVKKAAILVTEDIFAQVSVEQLMEEESSGAFEVQYFEDAKLAKEWLLA